MELLRSMGFCLAVLDHMRPSVGELDFWLRLAGVFVFSLGLGVWLRCCCRLGLERACLFGD